MTKIISTDFFETVWLCWKIAGAARLKGNLKIPYMAYSIYIQIVVTLYYPFHLQMALFRNDTQADNMKNLAVCVTCTACSLKFLIYMWNIRKVYQIESLLRVLDDRISSEEEEKQFARIGFNIRGITYVFLGIYTPIGVTAAMSFIFKADQGLLYPAWFPFDWRVNMYKYLAANFYQVGGIFYQIMQNYSDDSFPAISLCLLSGHIRMLAIRVSKIGYHKESHLENEQELLKCIQDQKNLYILFGTIQSLVSMPMLIQITVSAVNICVAMAALIFYVHTPMEIIYYFIYFLAMPLQIFPTCYYGSDIQLSFGSLPYAIFCSNWTSQSRTYKKHMQLFVERSLKPTTAFAGAMVRIHLDTFFSTCKGAYSLFAVIMRIKK